MISSTTFSTPQPLHRVPEHVCRRARVLLRAGPAEGSPCVCQLFPQRKFTIFEQNNFMEIPSSTTKRLRTNAPTGRVDGNWTESGGKAPSPGFLLVSELPQDSHYPETRASPGAYLHRIDISGPGRVDMLTPPVAAARNSVATGASG